MDIFKTLNQLGDLARATAMRYFRSPLAIEHKSAEQPVTIADRTIEQLMRCYLEKHYPEDGILGEEYGEKQGQGQRLWVLDPIDGTKAFISALPTFVSLVALYDLELGVIAAMIEVPAMGERFLAARGKGAFWDAKPIHVAKPKALGGSVMSSTSIDMFQGNLVAPYGRLSQQVAGRRFGGDGYAMGLMAAGFFDFIVEADLQPYDYLAPALIIREAGGFVSDWQGKPLCLREGNGTFLASASSEQHKAALALLAG